MQKKRESHLNVCVVAGVERQVDKRRRRQQHVAKLCRLISSDKRQSRRGYSNIFVYGTIQMSPRAYFAHIGATAIRRARRLRRPSERAHRVRRYHLQFSSISLVLCYSLWWMRNAMHFSCSRYFICSFFFLLFYAPFIGQRVWARARDSWKQIATHLTLKHFHNF